MSAETEKKFPISSFVVLVNDSGTNIAAGSTALVEGHTDSQVDKRDLIVIVWLSRVKRTPRSDMNQCNGKYYADKFEPTNHK